MRTMEMSAKTVEEAVQAACDALGVDRNDLGVTYEVLEFPTRKFFKTIPAKVRVTVEEPEVAAAPVEPVEAPAAPVAVEQAKAEPTVEEVLTEAAAAVEEVLADMEPVAAAPQVVEGEQPLDIDSDPRLKAAVDYLSEIFTLMGAQGFTFTAVQKGEATILRVSGEHMGVLIGRRGETMESLSYLASLVVNRMDGPYVKLGIDVGGYRDKRESDLQALAQRLAARVKRSGYRYEMEPMNPYERHIIHTAVAEIEGVRSESAGDGPNRRVVLYSTDPNASNYLDRDSYRPHTGRPGGRPAGRGPRPGNGRGPRREGNRAPRGPRSNVPTREFADRPYDSSMKPQAPKRTERIHDGDDFEMFGKIEL